MTTGDGSKPVSGDDSPENAEQAESPERLTV